ncbi:hypothetical protein DL771_004890 [Monosporascus sp. 5C6A]|nr:hypothetical protein DL771_004890 [Monosporascus sp. 5C6A]
MAEHESLLCTHRVSLRISVAFAVSKIKRKKAEKKRERAPHAATSKAGPPVGGGARGRGQGVERLAHKHDVVKQRGRFAGLGRPRRGAATVRWTLIRIRVRPRSEDCGSAGG